MGYCKECMYFRGNTLAESTEDTGVCQLDGRIKDATQYGCIFYSKNRYTASNTKPAIVYRGESEATLLNIICDIASESANYESNITPLNSPGNIILEDRYFSSWIASYNIFHGWYVMKIR